MAVVEQIFGRHRPRLGIVRALEVGATSLAAVVAAPGRAVHGPRFVNNREVRLAGGNQLTFQILLTEDLDTHPTRSDGRPPVYVVAFDISEEGVRGVVLGVRE